MDSESKRKTAQSLSYSELRRFETPRKNSKTWHQERYVFFQSFLELGVRKRHTMVMIEWTSGFKWLFVPSIYFPFSFHLHQTFHLLKRFVQTFWALFRVMEGIICVNQLIYEFLMPNTIDKWTITLQMFYITSRVPQYFS